MNRRVNFHNADQSHQSEAKANGLTCMWCCYRFLLVAKEVLAKRIIICFIICDKWFPFTFVSRQVTDHQFPAQRSETLYLIYGINIYPINLQGCLHLPVSLTSLVKWVPLRVWTDNDLIYFLVDLRNFLFLINWIDVLRALMYSFLFNNILKNVIELSRATQQQPY